MKVYLISTYNEYGAEEVRATIDKAKVESLLLTHPTYIKIQPNQFEEEEHPIERLKYTLEKDEVIDGLDLTSGWGGFQLHIVELE